MSSELREKLVIPADKRADCETLCIRLSADGHFLAQGCSNGEVKVVNTHFGYTSFRLHEVLTKPSTMDE